MPPSQPLPVVLLRRAVPHIIEGLVGPSVAFLSGRQLFGLLGGVAFAFGWAAGCMTVRAIAGRRISGLLMIAMISVVLRSVAGLLAHSSTAYFLGPDAVTAAMGAVFAISALCGRPLIGRVLGDIVPPELFDPAEPESARLCRLASLAWGMEQMVVSVVTAVMLFHLPTTEYVALHEPVSLVVFGVVLVAWVPVLLPEVRAARGRRRAAALVSAPPAAPLASLVAAGPVPVLAAA